MRAKRRKQKPERISCKGSYTVEAAVIVSIFLWSLTMSMKLGLDLYHEVRMEQEASTEKPLWEVDEFYFYQIWQYGDEE